MARDLEAVIAAADQALRTWEPVWTPFLDGALLEQAQERLAGLAELEMASRGATQELNASGCFCSATTQPLMPMKLPLA